MVVTLRFAGGNGTAAQRGSAWLSTLGLDGTRIGDMPEERDAEYNLHKRSKEIGESYPANARPAPSAVYELLRFGRVINTTGETLTPADVPHWRHVAYPGGRGWVNLNAQGVRKFSDADFPHWRQWQLIDDSADQDSRCDSAKLKGWLDISGNGQVDPNEATSRLADADLAPRFARTICKFPTEWDADSVDQRWGWLKSSTAENPTPLTDADFALLRAHIAALAFFPGGTGLPTSHWHFQPREFIRHFRMCGWLSSEEFAQCFPRSLLHLTGTQFQAHQVPWATAIQNSRRWSLVFNRSAQKYLSHSAPHRLLHFISNVVPETGYLRLVREQGADGASYAPYIGRGLIQLTHLDGYKAYGDFKQFPTTVTTGQFSALGWNPDTLIAHDNNGNHNYANCADTAFFYVVKRSNMLRHMDAGIDQDSAITVCKDINGYVAIENLNGLDARLQTAVFLKYVLMDNTTESLSEPMTFSWRRNSQKEIVYDAAGNIVMTGNPPHPKKKFYVTEHNINVSLAPQRP
jgi:hydroxyethylthiazole kinase